MSLPVRSASDITLTIPDQESWTVRNGRITGMTRTRLLNAVGTVNSVQWRTRRGSAMRVSVPARVRHSVALPAGGYTCAHCRRKVSFDDGTRRVQLIVTRQHQRDQLKHSARPLQERDPNISEPTPKRRRVKRSDGATRKRVDVEITVRNRAEIAVTTTSKLDCPSQSIRRPRGAPRKYPVPIPDASTTLRARVNPPFSRKRTSSMKQDT